MPRLSPEELASRRTGMGSTCVVEAAGLAPWNGAGPMRLFCEKLGIEPPDDAEADGPEQVEWLEWGHIQEPVIADWYERRMGVKLQLGGPVFDGIHWATLDRKVIGQSRLLEVKNVGSPQLYSHWDVTSQDGIPRYVRAQVTVAMGYHGAQETDVAASIGGRPPHVWTVFFDRELYDLLMHVRDKFWGEHVLTGSPPPMDHTPACKEYLRHKYPSNIDRRIIEATAEAEHWGNLRASATKRAAELKREMAKVDAELLAHVGENYGIQGDGWKMTWSVGKDGRRRQRFTARGVEGE